MCVKLPLRDLNLSPCPPTPEAHILVQKKWWSRVINSDGASLVCRLSKDIVKSLILPKT